MWACLLSLLALSGCQRDGRLVEHHLLEFGTLIQISLITDDLEQADRLLSAIEERLALYRGYWHAWEDSELTKFNRALAQNGRAPLPDSLKPLILSSQKYYAASEGLFNPALGKLIAAYGFHGGEPDQALIEALRSDLPGMDDLMLHQQHAISRHPDLQIDLGAIAKGYAIGQIAEMIESRGISDYLVNAGGDLVTGGSRFGKPWRIGIQNPWAPGAVAGIELTGRYSLFTSGNYRRQYRSGDSSRHHIIDPRSGEPSFGQSSATVLLRNPVRADVAATALMVDGARAHRRLAQSLEAPDYLIITDSRQLIISRSLADKLEISVNWPIKIVN